MANANILSERYVTPEMNHIFSREGTIIAERELWIAVMKAQKELGLDIPSEDIEKFEDAKYDIDFDEIKEIEKDTRHDVKAKIQSYINTAGAGEHIHKGMTSRDLTDNVEQTQILRASKIVFGKYISILRHVDEKSHEYSDIVLAARTHHQPAQPTLLGKRFSMWNEELLYHLPNLENFIEYFPLRGIKGPVGTQFDMLNLLGNSDKVDALERRVAEQLGFKETINSPGQVYSRSLDYDLITNLSKLASPIQSLSVSMRLMAGAELVTEGFKEGQVGSSAMPHKMNTRSSERITGFSKLLKMYADGASRNSGDQWEEGDVSCSVVRRVIIPNSFYASDGLCETTLTVMNEMGAYPAVIDEEVDRYLPFLATTELLMMAVKAGIGREEAHKVIKGYAISEALRMRETGSRDNRLPELLAEDNIFSSAGISYDDIYLVLKEREHFIGRANYQIDSVSEKIRPWLEEYHKESQYEPKQIL